MADDPLQSLLDRTALSKAQKAGLWDLYHAAKNTDDLDARLKTLDLPRDIKSDLWDLKSSESAPSARADGTPKGGGFFGTLQRPDGRVSTELSIGVGFDGKETQIPLLVPSLTKGEVDTLLALGDKDPIPESIADKAVKYAKLRMQAGKPVFAEPSEVGKFKPLPYGFDPNRQRKDTAVVGVGAGKESAQPDPIGIDPELVGPAALQAWKAAVAPGLSAAGRVIAGAVSAAGQAAPIISSEAVRHGLRYVGVPEPIPSLAADLLLARTSRGKGAARAAETEAEAAPVTFPKPTEPTLTPLEMTRKNRAAWQAEHMAPHGPMEQPYGPLPKPAPETVVQEFKAFADTAKKTKLSAVESSLVMKLIQRGVTAEKAVQQVKALPEAWKVLPRDEDVEAIVRAANQTGRMTR